jgi:N-acetylglutamate synthase-like GNAT family acetyltransferase
VDPSSFNARRANPEDLQALESLWQQAGLPWDQLGGFLQEFLVVTEGDETVVGAVGLLIEGDDALLHSEAIHPAVDADAVRAALWRRMQIVARNQGVKALWTQEDAPYWQASGFDPAPADRVESSRASFMDRTATWRLFPLVDPNRIRDVLDEQFAILEASRLQSAETLQKRIRTIRLLAIVIALGFAAITLAIFFKIASAKPDIFRQILGN